MIAELLHWRDLRTDGYQVLEGGKFYVDKARIPSVLEKQRRLALMILAAVCLTYFVENFLRSAASALTPVLIVELGNATEAGRCVLSL